MAQLMQLKNAQQTGVVNQMAIDKGQRQQADQAAYRNMLAQPGFNSNDPATRAQMLGLGRGEDLTSLDASAKTQRDLAKTAYDERAASYKAGAPFNGSAEDYLNYFDAGAQDPVLGAHWEQNEGGIAPMRARLVQVLSTPEGLAHVREMAGGQTQAGRDTHDVAMAKIAEAKARAAKDGQPTAVKPPAIHPITIEDPDNPGQNIVVDASNPTVPLGKAGITAGAQAAQIKKETAAEAKQVAQSQVDSLLDSLSQDAENLYKQGGIPSIKDPAMSNIGKWAKNTTVGLGISKAIGTEAQSTLERMKSTKLQLLNAIKAATGMSSKTLDSNQELKIWLDSLGTTGGTLESITEIIKNLRSYGEGAGTTPPPDGGQPAAGGARPPLSSFNR
jgi:hypothetical protein